MTAALTHHPTVDHHPGTRWQPEELTVSCTCGRWAFESQESAGGPVESWADAWEEHLEETDQP